MIPIWYNDYKNFIENSLSKYLEKYFEQRYYSQSLINIKEASFYAIKWWKRIRSILALEFYLVHSKKTLDDLQIEDDIMKFCIALELIHAYSLVHDDLPAMDNDVFRRWEFTVWKKFWEANGILVWDLLNSLAFEVLSEIGNNVLLKLFWQAVWIKWMLGWQVLDLYYENNPEKLTLENLIEVHNNKTGALIKVSIIWGLLLANASKSDILKFEVYWEKIGLAFQVKDDILDVEWTKEETGKSVGWEQKWFVYFLGLEKSKEYLMNLMKESLGMIQNLHSEKLEFLTRYIRERRK